MSSKSAEFAAFTSISLVNCFPSNYFFLFYGTCDVTIPKCQFWTELIKTLKATLCRAISAILHFRFLLLRVNIPELRCSIFFDDLNFYGGGVLFFVPL